MQYFSLLKFIWNWISSLSIVWFSRHWQYPWNRYVINPWYLFIGNKLPDFWSIIIFCHNLNIDITNLRMSQKYDSIHSISIAKPINELFLFPTETEFNYTMLKWSTVSNSTIQLYVLQSIRIRAKQSLSFFTWPKISSAFCALIEWFSFQLTILSFTFPTRFLIRIVNLVKVTIIYRWNCLLICKGIAFLVEIEVNKWTNHSKQCWGFLFPLFHSRRRE